MRTRSILLSISLMAAAALLPLTSSAALAQSGPVHGVLALAATVPSYQDDYADWRQQIRVASPTRHNRWNAAPAGAVRVYNRRFDPRWNWRAAPRYRVVYSYYRGDMWFLDPTTGWAYSIDRYGIVYTADPYRGWVYSLGPLTRWTADLLYFFDLYRFDRGYWYCRDYDYLVDLWEENSRYGYYTYDTAYSTLWDWEPYFGSSTFISYSNSFTTIWVTQVRSNYDYVERNPRYRRELIDSIGLPAVNAAPPRSVSPRAVTTSAYWEARDLAGAGMAPPPRGREAGRGFAAVAAGTVVDARQAPARVVDPGAPTPGFNAPFPSGTYGFGVPAGAQEHHRDSAASAASAGRARDLEQSGVQPTSRDWRRNSAPPPYLDESKPAASTYGTGRDRDTGVAQDRRDAEPSYQRGLQQPRARVREDTPPQFEAPSYTPPPAQYPRSEGSRSGRSDSAASRARDTGASGNIRQQPRVEQPREQPRAEKPAAQPRAEKPAEDRREKQDQRSETRSRDRQEQRQA